MKNIMTRTVGALKSGADRLFGGKENSEKKIDRRVASLGAQLSEMGFERAKVACVAPDNSFSARISDTAVKMLSGKFLRFDPEKCGDIIDIIDKSGAALVFCDGESEKLFRENRDRMPRVKYFVCFKRKHNEGDFLSFASTLFAGSLLLSCDQSV